MLLLLVTMRSGEMRLRAGGSRLTSLAAARSSTAAAAATTTAKEYLLEFRGSQPSLRFQEFYDALNYCTGYGDRWGVDSTAHRAIVRDRSSEVPICTYIAIPGGDSVAAQLVQRCSLVRSIVECWADATTSEEASRMAFSNSLLMNKNGSVVRPGDSWRVSFRRYGRGGRSGLNYDEKNLFLSKFNDTLRSFKGAVNLTSPQHDFLYLEDNFDYHDRVTIASAKQGYLKGSEGFASIESQYLPLRALFGRVVASGDEYIGDTYSLKTRPFIGTTTMDPVAAHCTAVAAMIGPGDVVLDPFCGTGGLLVSCASLGATVVEAPRDVGGGIRTAAVRDPFGNVLGIIENPHFAFRE